MSAYDLERWKAHFRFRQELDKEEWYPIYPRELTLADVAEKADEAARKLERWGA